MAMIAIDFDDRTILDALRELSLRAHDLGPALREIGVVLVDSTQRRFDTSTGPDGARWEENSDTTILEYLGGMKGAYGKKGGLTKKGMAALLGKKPLLREGFLQGTLSWQIDGNTLLVGSPQKYAAAQQFGAEKGSLGKGAPWGDIPARPFLGVSDADEETILDLLRGYLVP